MHPLLNRHFLEHHEGAANAPPPPPPQPPCYFSDFAQGLKRTRFKNHHFCEHHERLPPPTAPPPPRYFSDFLKRTRCTPAPLWLSSGSAVDSIPCSPASSFRRCCASVSVLRSSSTAALPGQASLYSQWEGGGSNTRGAQLLKQGVAKKRDGVKLKEWGSQKKEGGSPKGTGGSKK